MTDLQDLLRRVEEALGPWSSVYHLVKPVFSGDDETSQSEFAPQAWPRWGDYRRAAELREEIRALIAKDTDHAG